MTTDQAQQAHAAEIDTSLLPVGAALRAKREQLGWSLPDIAAWLRIKLSYLEALESGQVSKLPGSAYALGFLRGYCGVLGLDAEDMSRRFRHEAKEINRRPELLFPAPVPERGVPAGAVVLLGVLVVVGAYVGWYELTAHEHGQTHVVPPVPAPLLPYAGTNAVSTPSPQVATVMPGPGHIPSPLPPAPASPRVPALPPVPVSAPTAGSAVPVATTATVMPPPASQAARADASVAAPVMVASQAALPPAASATPSSVPQAAAVTASSAGPTAPPGQITLKALAVCWVQVRQVGGKVLYDRVLQPGESWAVPADSGAVTLSTGNAGGLTLAADGVTTPPLGRNGTVRRAIPLSLQAIHDGSIVNDASTSGAPAATAVASSSAAQPSAAPSPATTSHDAGAPASTVPSPGKVRPVAQDQPASPHDESADSLNARQLQHLGAH